MLLENIKVLNYSNIDKRVGFDTDETLAIIKVFNLLFKCSRSNMFGRFSLNFVEYFSN